MRALATIGFILALVPQTGEAQFTWRQTAGPNGGAVLSFVTDQQGRLLAGCQFGAIYRIAPNGNAWVRLNPGMTDRDIAGMARSPIDGALYAGSRGRAVYVSRNNGETWNRTAGQPGSTEVVAVLVRSNGDLVAGTFGGGVFISTNGGTTWTEANGGLGTTQRKRVTALVELGATIYAATGGGILQYTGSDWVKRDAGLPDSSVYDLALTSGGDLLTGQGFRGVWQSTDAGQSWSQVGSEMFAAVTVGEGPGGVLLAGDAQGGVRIFEASAWSAPNNLPVVNAFGTSGDSIIAAAEGGVFRSRDKGATWSQVNNSLANGWVLSLLVKDTGPVFAGTAHNGIMRLPFAGSDWFQADTPPEPVSSVLGMAVNDAGHLFAATQYWGLWKSTDNGATWMNVTSPPLPSGLKTVVAGPGALLFAGSNFGGSANGVYVSTDGGVSWTKNVTGMVTTMVQSLAYDQDRDILYAGTYGGGAFVSSDRGATWDSAGTSDAYVMAIAISRNTGEVFIAGGFGGGKVYRSSNTGQSWALDSVPTWRNVVALAHDDTREMLYAGTFLDGVFRTSSAAGTSWEQVNEGLPNLQVEALAVDDRTGVLYAGVRGEGVFAGFSSPPAVLSRTRANLSLPIADPGEISDAATLVAGSGLGKLSAEPVASVVVTIGDVTHTEVNDLTILLEHGGLEVELLSGLSGANLSGIILSDTATMPIVSGSAPYTGSFLPSAPLSAFQGTDPEGTWTLIIRDGTAGNAGTLNAWGVTAVLGPTTAVVDHGALPASLRLEQNYPNPFNPSTAIEFVLPESGRVVLEVYDLLGRRLGTILDGFRPAGAHRAVFDASVHSSGVYLYRLSAGGAVLTRRMVLLR